jgi:hypothetical protein
MEELLDLEGEDDRGTIVERERDRVSEGEEEKEKSGAM